MFWLVLIFRTIQGKKKEKEKPIKRAITHAIWANMLANVFGLTSMFINTHTHTHSGNPKTVCIRY